MNELTILEKIAATNGTADFWSLRDAIGPDPFDASKAALLGMGCIELGGDGGYGTATAMITERGEKHLSHLREMHE